MFDLLGLFGAIVLVMLVLLLRAILSLPFASTRARFVPASPPAGTAELFEAATSDLAALGFGAPRWVWVERVDGAASILPLRAVCAHPEGGLAWLAPPINSKAPHRLFVLYIDRLADGRAAISQPFECYYAATQTREIVARGAAERGYREQWQAHRRWVAGLGSQSIVCDDEAVLDQVVGLVERQRQELLARGDLIAVTDTLAVPRPVFALRLLWQLLRAPKPPPDPRPVPAERLALLARVHDQMRQRAPPRRIQFGLFGASVVLFMLLGALLWDLRFALVLLVVVLIHELGHFLAMRAFGYRNVHILALPLVGGVAMGVDAQPGATRSAWMSLMGPLPGILIGWVLAVIAVLGLAPDAAQAWLWPFALTFLVVNYLNVLPVPPLDGAHVVSALLPLRYAWLQTAFLAIAATLGAVFAAIAGLPLLAVLAGLQLLAVPANWRTRRAEAELAASNALPRQAQARLLGILRHLERRLGAARNPRARINDALQIATRLDTVPMGTVSRTLTGAVYLLLLLVPIAAIVSVSLPFQGMVGTPDAALIDYQQQLAEHQATASAMPMADLLRASPTIELPAPVSPQQLAAAEARLGRALPPDLLALYREADGAPGFALLPVAEVAPAGPWIERELAPYIENLTVELADGEATRWQDIPIKDAAGWWHLGGFDEVPIFYLPVPDPRLPGIRVLEYDLEAPRGYASLRAWLETAWAGVAQAAAETSALELAKVAARAALRDVPMQELLQTWPRPSLLVRWMSPVAEWPAAAEPEALRATATRLGRELPPELDELLRLHDGFPPLALLASHQIDRWSTLRPGMDDALLASVVFAPREAAPDDAAAGVPIGALDEAQLRDCLLVAGQVGEPAGTQAWPQLLWCPASATPWLDLGARRRHASLREWIVERAVPMKALQDRYGADG